MSFTSSEWHRWDLHLHTASSYDYKYKGEDADDKLYQALVDADIRAAAITDHFKVDADRINRLREIASGKDKEEEKIVFFPGVELRTDKGSKSNLHVILIFSDVEENLYDLCAAFNVFKSDYAKSSKSDETIYWIFNDVIDFAKRHNALISIHAGGKSQGIDGEISNTLPVSMAIKEDIVKDVHFLEMGRKRDFDDYEEHVFPDLAKQNT